jgi:hypothetical protein
MELMLGRRYSHETISKPTDRLIASAEGFRSRPLPEEAAFVYLDLPEGPRGRRGRYQASRIRSPGDQHRRQTPYAGL